MGGFFPVVSPEIDQNVPKFLRDGGRYDIIIILAIRQCVAWSSTLTPLNHSERRKLWKRKEPYAQSLISILATTRHLFLNWSSAKPGFQISSSCGAPYNRPQIKKLTKKRLKNNTSKIMAHRTCHVCVNFSAWLDKTASTLERGGSERTAWTSLYSRVGHVTK